MYFVTWCTHGVSYSQSSCVILALTSHFNSLYLDLHNYNSLQAASHISAMQCTLLTFIIIIVLVSSNSSRLLRCCFKPSDPNACSNCLAKVLLHPLFSVHSLSAVTSMGCILIITFLKHDSIHAYIHTYIHT